ncbi:MAG: SulP family inorganic anion transporter [Parachlamydiales bacterium]|jgi:SulP family sulfate permease
MFGAFRSEVRLFPFLEELRRYNLKSLKEDLIAAFSVALLAIPQSIAYALLAGLPPSAGFFAAIFGAIFAAAFGSSRQMVVGPTTAVAILIQTSVADIIFSYYPEIPPEQKTALTLQILSHIVIVMGFLQMFFGFFNLGKLLQFVSRSVIMGYFVGVVIAIMVNQLYPFLGLTSIEEGEPVIFKFLHLIGQFWHLHLPTAALGLSALLLLFYLRRFPRLPDALFMLVLISAAAFFLNAWQKPFWQISALKDLGQVSFPRLDLHFPNLDLRLLNRVMPAALAITFLGILEVFSVFRTIASKDSCSVNANQQIFAVGVANSFLAFLLGAMPASGSISRTLLNSRNKAKSRLAAIFSGLLVWLFLYFGWKLIGSIPLVALAAILLFVVPGMVDFKQIRFCFTATKGDALVFLLTMFSCFFFSLDVAFFLGIVISIALYLKKAAIPHMVEYAFNSAGRLVIILAKQRVHRKIRIVGIAGELFFAAVDLFQHTLQEVAKDPFVEVIVVRLNNVYYMDASMCYALVALKEYLKKTKRFLLISGITPEVFTVFDKAGLVYELGRDNLFLTDESSPQFSTWQACQRAEELID